MSSGIDRRMVTNEYWGYAETAISVKKCIGAPLNNLPFGPLHMSRESNLVGLACHNERIQCTAKLFLEDTRPLWAKQSHVVSYRPNGLFLELIVQSNGSQEPRHVRRIGALLLSTIANE